MASSSKKFLGLSTKKDKHKDKNSDDEGGEFSDNHDHEDGDQEDDLLHRKESGEDLLNELYSSKKSDIGTGIGKSSRLQALGARISDRMSASSHVDDDDDIEAGVMIKAESSSKGVNKSTRTKTKKDKIEKKSGSNSNSNSKSNRNNHNTDISDLMDTSLKVTTIDDDDDDDDDDGLDSDGFVRDSEEEIDDSDEDKDIENEDEYVLLLSYATVIISPIVFYNIINHNQHTNTHLYNNINNNNNNIIDIGEDMHRSVIHV